VEEPADAGFDARGTVGSSSLTRRFEGAPREASSIQEVQFLPRQGPASHRESSLALCEATTMAKRRQSDQQATTKVKRTSLVTDLVQRPTGSSSGKATVDAGYGDCVGDAAGVDARGTLGNG
jgi:hypothetical protein